MDEPSANLDQPEILHIRDLLLKLSPQTSLIISEHRVQLLAQGERDLLTAKGMGFSYYRRQKKLLQDVDFSIAAGASIGLIGKNGIGKSTFAKLLAGLIAPRHGKILLGTRKAARWRLQKEVWYVMQETTYQLFTDSVWRELFLNLEQTPALVTEAEQLLVDLKISHLSSIRQLYLVEKSSA
ncbi:hypothetical protein FC81_GL001179 [Liquorilactobacillus capillatus DSM 19910]|uniref:ABC transporter domain-containing protein n=1 Tax=Liquorilactobacillus capillatus DSM 19910 TaxID=1423731 RepID=A0A0R1MDF2_9LACO|nr:ATP-binding cassette domain-containing protein [Liquorilactobacillus capillatus]KRL01496.1 hypothetical protein FC81_GL001179 [Liquorilactobacillus capillatus DSM 19910]